MPPKVDPTEVRYSKRRVNAVNIKVFGGEAGPAATLAPKLGPLGLVILHHYCRTPRRSEKTSLRKDPNGRESES